MARVDLTRVADAAQQINTLVGRCRQNARSCAAARVNATKAIKEQIVKGMSGVKHFDALIIKQFASNWAV